MPLGIQSDYRVNNGDTAELRKNLYNESEQLVPVDDILEAEVTVQLPDRTQVTNDAEIEADGTAFYRWENTAALGEYLYIFKFTLITGEVRSERGSFEVIDPFNPPEPTGMEILSNVVWLKLEDCFDSSEGGPWLRDETLSYFNKNKIPEFVPDGLLDINLTPPETNVTINEFTLLQPDGSNDPDLPLLAQSTLLAVIRHLMRSYVEQPNPTGAPVMFEDRRDYLQRWQTIYQMELERFNRIVALWKRRYIGLGHSKMLVGSKAGRLAPAPMRSRNIGRGGVY